MIRRLAAVLPGAGLLALALVLAAPPAPRDPGPAATGPVVPRGTDPEPVVLVDAAWDTPQQQVASINLVAVLHNVLGTGFVVAFPGDPVPGPVALTVRQIPGRDVVIGPEVLAGDEPEALQVLASDAGRAALAARLETGFARPREDGLLRSGLRVTDGTPVTLAELGGWPSRLWLEGVAWEDEAWAAFLRSAAEDGRVQVFFNGLPVQPAVSFRAQTIPGSYRWDLPLALAGIVNTVDRRQDPGGALPPVAGARLAGMPGGVLRGYLPETMAYLGGPGQALVTIASPDEARAVALLLGAISAFRYEPLSISLAADRPAWSVAWGAAALAEPALPLVPGRPASLADIRTGEPLLLDPLPVPLAAIQYGPGPRPRLVVQDVAGDGRAVLDLARGAADPRRFAALSGNVVVPTSDGVPLAIDHYNRALVILQPAAAGPVDPALVRLGLVPLVILLAVVFWALVYRRVGRPVPVPPEPKGSLEL